MATIQNGCSLSTTYEWRKVKITAAPQAQGIARAKRAPLGVRPDAPACSAAELRRSRYVQIRMRGGAEMWWEITYGSVTKRFPGYVPIDDVLLCMFTHGARCPGHREERT